jgi:DnaJ-class molecular chaperone
MGAPRDFLGYFAALGLEEEVESAGCEDIKAAFRRVAMKLHPDTQTKQSEKAREKATAQFLHVQVAYEVSAAAHSARGEADVHPRTRRARVGLVTIG